MSAPLEGNTSGLKSSQLRALSRLGQRRYPAEGGFTTDQARELALLSRSIGRQIGLLIDRRGYAAMILVGTPSSVYIPELPRKRIGGGRLRGLRLLHTHLTQDVLSEEDLMDMLFLRLDSASVLTVNDFGEPVSFQSAHLMPSGKEAYRVHATCPWDQIHINFAEEAEALEKEFAERLPAASDHGEMQASAVLVSVSPEPKTLQERHLEELRELARSAGLSVTGTLIQRVASMPHRSILGKSKLAELETLALQGQASHIIFDGELSPAQLQALSEVTERSVLDRTLLILDIFAGRARTKAGKLQVEMAQLRYMQPRLAGKNRAMDRLMGGIGGRGPGETKLETDRRRIRDRIAGIRRELDALRRQRSFVRQRRSENGLPTASLVGYTNAGKSTLLNAMTHSSVPAEDRLFATLDPTVRRLRVPGEREIVLSDTVGFIRNLPGELMEAFRATLEELESSDLFLHVLDASHPEAESHMQAVGDILAELQLSHIPSILVLNKWDAADHDTRSAFLARFPDAVPVSAVSGYGLDVLFRRIEHLAIRSSSAQR
ncbi:MAG: GTPase HflX [Desulfovibrionaceae bacterium]|nr:GTPase HflX [Desulfovibrionaceae bacterium]